MTRIQSYAERNITIDSSRVITVPATTAVLVLLDESKTRGEIASRVIQNVGANPMFYNEGETTDTGAAYCNGIDKFHGVIASMQQLDCSGHRKPVSVYSTLGTTVATTVKRRSDLGHHN